MNLRDGRKIYGQIFSLPLWSKFQPDPTSKMYMIIMDNF
jgi:hypothetical protein